MVAYGKKFNQNTFLTKKEHLANILKKTWKNPEKHF